MMTFFFLFLALLKVFSFFSVGFLKILKKILGELRLGGLVLRTLCDVWPFLPFLKGLLGNCFIFSRLLKHLRRF